MKDGVFSSDIKLVDSSGQLLAKYEIASFSKSKQGRIHITDYLDDAIVDLIVITGVVKMEKQGMDNNISGSTRSGTRHDGLNVWILKRANEQQEPM